jgi:internalin A
VLAAPGHAGPPVTGGPPPAGNPTVKLLNRVNGDELCLSPAGGGNALNNPVVQYYCDADPARLWEILTRSDGYVELYDESSGLCLSPAGGGTAAGTPLVQYRCDSDAARGWSLVPAGDAAGSYLIRNEHSTLCVSVGAARAANAQVGQSACDNTDPTRWSVSWHDAIADVHSLWCLDPSSDAVNATIVQAGCANYRITMDTTGGYVIRDTDNQLCLSPAGGSTARNAAVVQYYCDTDPSRHWQVTRVGGAY